jgi:hypothetical protein
VGEGKKTNKETNHLCIFFFLQLKNVILKINIYQKSKKQKNATFLSLHICYNTKSSNVVINPYNQLEVNRKNLAKAKGSVGAAKFPTHMLSLIFKALFFFSLVIYKFFGSF